METASAPLGGWPVATIYDVAKRANVSPKTVSKVLNGDAPVSQKTREAVSEGMTALGYVPSHAARSIKSNKSGLITGAISSADEVSRAAGLPELFIVQGAQAVVEQSRKTLLISDTGGQLDRVPDLMRTFQEHRVEGILYVADFHKLLDITLAERLGIETVVDVKLKDGSRLLVSLAEDRIFEPGQAIELGFDPAHAHLFASQADPLQDAA